MNALVQIVLLLHFASTWAMVGLIWFVQIVHYPLFAQVGRDEFPLYERRHKAWTTWIVAPLMLTELLTAIVLCVWRPVVAGSLARLVWTRTGHRQLAFHRLLAGARSRGSH